MWYKLLKCLVMWFFSCFHTSRQMYGSVLVVTAPTNNHSFLLSRNGWSMPLWLTVSVIIPYRPFYVEPWYRSVNTWLNMPLEGYCPFQDRSLIKAKELGLPQDWFQVASSSPSPFLLVSNLTSPPREGQELDFRCQRLYKTLCHMDHREQVFRPFLTWK